MGHKLSFDNSKQGDLNYQYFFNSSRNPLLIINQDGLIINSNPVAKKYNLIENTNILSIVIQNEAEKAKEKLKELKEDNSSDKIVTIEFSSFPEFLVQTRWSVILLNDNVNFAFRCEELSHYSPEDFLLHKGLMRTIFDSDPNLIAIVNHVGHYLFANQALYKFAGKNNHFEVDSINQLIDDGELWLPGNEKKQAQIKEDFSEIELTTDHVGNPTWFENTKVPIKLPFGEDVTLIISKNITKWKLSDKKLEEFQDALDYHGKLSYLGEIIGKIAVDLNNPLTVTLNYIKNILPKQDEEINPQNETINISIQIMEDFIDKINKSSKMMKMLSKQNNNLYQEKTKIVEIMTFVMNSLQDKLKAFEINLVKKFTGYEDIEITCQPMDFNLAFRYLFINSIDAIILNQTQTNRLIEVELTKKDKKIYILISDNGVGIKDEFKKRIFEPFFSNKPTGKGTGLGLSIAKKIIEQMNGKISFESQENRTIFKIEFSN